MRNFLEKLPRRLLRWVAFWLPAERRRELERRLRGWEQHAKLRRADVVVVSFGKSGRTWLRVLLSRYYQLRYGLSERHLLGFDNLHARRRAIPRIFFTHDNYVQDYTGNRGSKRDFYDKRVILLVRSPQDVAVSQYFQWRHRMKPAKAALNAYPSQRDDVSMYDFVMGEGGGMPRIIDFMNLWAREIGKVRDSLVVRYEDLRGDPVGTFRQVVRFVGEPAEEATLREAVAYASVENMRALEARRFFWWGGRLKPKDRSNPDSYKVRRAKAGGYRDYFSPEEVGAMDALVRARLAPFYGYGKDDSDTGIGATPTG